MTKPESIVGLRATGRARNERTTRSALQVRLAMAGGLALVLAARAPAQTSGSYALSRTTVDAGGGTVSATGSSAAGGTIGQPDAGTATSGAFTFSGGFWAGLVMAPSPTPTLTPSPTPTDTPVGAVLNGSVTLQGRPGPPDARWSVPLQISLTPQGGGGAVSCTPTTDQSGNFTCDGFLPGSYAACVKQSHTLQNCTNVTLVAGANPVSFCTLREGDANDSNCVTLVDFSILASTFARCAGDAGFDARADFDGSACVTLVDFSLMATNFGQCGPLLCIQPAVPAARAGQ